jgi:hypothetical protein
MAADFEPNTPGVIAGVIDDDKNVICRLCALDERVYKACEQKAFALPHGVRCCLCGAFHIRDDVDQGGRYGWLKISALQLMAEAGGG